MTCLAKVLRCFPFERYRPRAILLETNRMEMREVDRFFHRKGYVNRETFVTADPRPNRAGEIKVRWTDNLFVPASGPRTVYPPTEFSQLECNAEEEREFRGDWCQPWHAWQPASNRTRLGACETEERT